MCGAVAEPHSKLLDQEINKLPGWDGMFAAFGQSSKAPNVP